MIEPYARYSGWDKLKRHHNLIMAMWGDYKNNSQIRAALNEIGCDANRKTISKYISRCLEEDGLSHDYSLPKPKGSYDLKCYKHHDEIAYMRNYLGYSCGEIGEAIGAGRTTVWRYIQMCYEDNL